MNRDQVQERLKALTDESKRLEATMLQVAGAIADCNFWLAKILEEESKAKEQANSATG